MNPYSLDLNQHPSNFDVLSLQSKQLPHRQQAHKPVLKYHASIIKPVKLFKQSDSYRLNLEKQLLGMQGISPVPGVPTPCLVMKPTLSAPQSGAGGRPGLSSALQADNSYQQPFSAKKVNHGVLYQQPDQKGVGNVTSALQNSVSEYVTTSVGSGSTLQYNSFMRPLSSKHSNSIVKTKNSQISGDSGKLSGRSTHKLKTVQKPLDRQGFTEQKQNKNHSDQLKTLQQRNQSSSNSQDSGIALGKKNLKYERDVKQRNSPISPASFVQNPNYTPNSELGSENSLRNRNISTVSQQSLKSNDVKTPTFSKTKHNQGPAQRGVNYAPGDASSNPHSIEQNIKPYVHDIKFSLSAVARGDAEMESFLLPAGAGEIQGLLERNYAFNEKVHTLLEVSATSLLSVKKGASFKLPDTDKLNHILYYKENLNENNRAKNHTAVSVLGEQRPRADGALTPDAQDMTEQKDVDNTSEEEASSEFEDVGSTPSGERLPGDGEAYCEDLNDEDDGINDLYEDNDEESDKCTVSSRISQISSSSSLTRPSTLQSTSTQTPVNGKEKTKLITRPYSSGEHVVHPSLRYSLFPAIPPTINFVAEGEKVERLPWEMRKLLKWRMSPITPNVVKSTLARSNFRITKKNNDWLGCFGKHMKAAGFKAIREYQKLNHFPGSFQLGRKDRLWRNLSRMQLSFGKKDFGFFPQSYVLPQDMKLLKRAWEDGGSRQKWIIKPPASARGIGIKVIHKWNQIPRRRPVLVQKYLSKPLLINDSKFDMRVYVYVTSYDPLRAYVFEDGLARFASSKYSSSLKSLGNKFMHLTNYSVNKYNSEYQSNTDDTVCQGHKWSLKSLWSYLQEHGVNTATIWDNIKDIVVKTLISAETNINSMIKANTRSRYVAHELFGFDILLDQKMQPWVLEVNISPSLHSNSPLDITIKGQMIRDLLNLAGFRIPDKNDVAHSAHPNSSAIDMSAHLPPNDYCMDKRLFTSQLSADERAKHAFFCNRHQDQQALQTILDTLTPDDIRILTESIDEDSRKGGFIRVFPTPNTHKYLRYLEQPRYYNLLLDQWVQRYNHLEQRGISLLQSFCEDGIHLENPTENYRHQWSPPNSSVIISTRDTKQSQTSPTKGKEQFGVSLTRGKDSPLVKSSHSVAQLPRVPGLPSKVPKESSLSLCASISAPSTLNR